MEHRRNRSRQRQAVLDCLRASDEHPSAEQIYRQLKCDNPRLSLGTVYRNLALLKADGLIGSVGVEDGLERYDRSAAPHAHFICRRCHRVIDAAGIGLSEPALDRARQALGVQIDACELTLRGLCPACLNEPDA